MTTKTLADRVKWIVANRGFRTPTALSRASGLSPGHAGQITRGDVKGNQTPETLEKLARGGRVDLTWLATGQGEPGPDVKSSEVTVERHDRPEMPATDEEFAGLLQFTIWRVAGNAMPGTYERADVVAAGDEATMVGNKVTQDNAETIATDYLDAAKEIRIEKGTKYKITRGEIAGRAHLRRARVRPEVERAMAEQFNADAAQALRRQTHPEEFPVQETETDRLFREHREAEEGRAVRNREQLDALHAENDAKRGGPTDDEDERTDVREKASAKVLAPKAKRPHGAR